jgi:cell division protein FtsX
MTKQPMNQNQKVAFVVFAIIVVGAVFLVYTTIAGNLAAM